MKLLISRDQRQDEYGSVSFGIVVRADLSPEEKSAISKYGFGKQVLFETPEPEQVIEKKGFLASIVAIQREFWNESLKVSNLDEGARFQYHSISEVLEVEHAIRAAVIDFKRMLDAAAGFGGEEVIEI